jgi:hypothetical protein
LGFENQANITEYFMEANGSGIFGFPFPAFASSSRPVPKNGTGSYRLYQG